MEILSAFEQLDATRRIYFTTKIRRPLRKRDSVNNREQTRLFNFPWRNRPSGWLRGVRTLSQFDNNQIFLKVHWNQTCWWFDTFLEKKCIDLSEVCVVWKGPCLKKRVCEKNDLHQLFISNSLTQDGRESCKGDSSKQQVEKCGKRPDPLRQKMAR